MKSIRDNRLFWFLKNLCALWRSDIYSDIQELKLQTAENKGALWNLSMHEIVCEIISYYERHPEKSNEYIEELDYLDKNGWTNFPYQKLKTFDNLHVGYDDAKKLNWVLHNDKRLYFPAHYSQSKSGRLYVNFIENENILGGNYRTKCPHQYQSDTFKIEDGDVLVDVGCAEALLSLDVIEKVKKVYLIESDLRWLPALKATFAPYKDKVVFVNKLVADTDSDTTITLAALLKEEQDNPLFIKMDIEGYETQVIGSSKDFLLNHPKAKVACCTYHKANDAETLEKMFLSYGYETTFSDGYMLFRPDCLTPPYFRKGVIRAQKKK